MSKAVPTTGLAGPIRLKRGFALLTAEERSRVSSLGGKESQRRGTANRFKKNAQASIAGRRGGIASGKTRRAKKRAAPPDMLETGGAAGGLGEERATGTVARGEEKGA